MHIRLASFLLALVGLFPAAGAAQEPATALCTPATISGLESVEFPQDRQAELRKYRNTQAFGYNANEFKLAVTVFIYDREPVTDLRQEFSASGAEVVRVHPDAKMPMNGKSKINLSGQDTTGYLGVFLWSEGKDDYASLLWVGEQSGKYVKIRASYIRPERDEDTGAAMAFVLARMTSVASEACAPAPTETAQ